MLNNSIFQFDTDCSSEHSSSHADLSSGSSSVQQRCSPPPPLPPKPKSLKLIGSGSATWQQVSQRLSLDHLNMLETKYAVEHDVEEASASCDSTTHKSNTGDSIRSMSVSDICKVFESKSVGPAASSGQKSARHVSSLISLRQSPEVMMHPDSFESSETFPVGLVQQRKMAFLDRPATRKADPTIESIALPNVAIDSNVRSVSTLSVAPQVSFVNNDAVTGNAVCPRLEELVELEELAPLSIDSNDADWSHRLQMHARLALQDDPVACDWSLHVIALQRESAKTGSIGITLAGGADYECKHITVRRRVKRTIVPLLNKYGCFE